MVEEGDPVVLLPGCWSSMVVLGSVVSGIVPVRVGFAVVSGG
jgi:hypothetical protein